MTYKVSFSRRAQADFVSLHIWIEDAAGGEIADAYVERLTEHCLKLAEYPNRGTPRDDIRQGVQSISFERKILIFYRLERNVVRILRVVSGARDIRLLLN